MFLAIARFASFAVVFLPTIVSGQMGPAYDRVDGLHDNDVLDAFAIRDVVFVYRDTDLPNETNAIKDLSKIISVDQAAIHGKPSREIRALIDLMLRTPHSPHLKEVSAVNHENSGYVWKLTWELFPSQGGFSGIPYQFRVQVNPDGTPIIPELYLCSHAMTASASDVTEESDTSDQHIFSVLPFSSLNLPIDPAKNLDGDVILSLATKVVNDPLTDVDETKQQQVFRFHSQSQLKIPVQMDDKGNLVKRNVWAVNFIRSSTTGDAIENANPLTVWVTPDGIVSELSIGHWQARRNRER